MYALIPYQQPVCLISDGGDSEEPGPRQGTSTPRASLWNHPWLKGLRIRVLGFRFRESRFGPSLGFKV